MKPIPGGSTVGRVTGALGPRPLALVAAYIAGGFVWIVVSDLVLAATVSHQTTLTVLQSVKGFAYVVVTGLLLYWRIRRELQFNSKALREAADARLRVDELLAFPRLLPFPIIVLAEDGALRFANPAARQLAEAAALDSVCDLLPSSHPRLVTDALGGRLKVSHFETSVDGRTFSWSFYATLTTRVVYAVGRDETESTELNERLADFEQSQVTGRLAAGIAHDFNNVLTVTRGYASFLAPRLAPGDPDRDTIEGILEACERGHDIADRLAHLGRPATPSTRTIDLSTEVASLTAFLRHAVPREVNLALDPASRPVFARLDRFEFSRLLLNLVVNAGDAMGAGGGEVTVGTRLVIEDGQTYARVLVRDNGPGMTPDVVEHIFEPFYTTHGGAGGTGLGLAIVQAVVKQHEGRVNVETAPGCGTCFFVDFPAVSGDDEAAA